MTTLNNQNRSFRDFTGELTNEIQDRDYRSAHFIILILGNNLQSSSVSKTLISLTLQID